MKVYNHAIMQQILLLTDIHTVIMFCKVYQCISKQVHLEEGGGLKFVVVCKGVGIAY